MISRNIFLLFLVLIFFIPFIFKKKKVLEKLSSDDSQFYTKSIIKSVHSILKMKSMSQVG